MPFFHEIPFSQNMNIIMANKISLNQKREYLPYIKSNFSRLSGREIARRLRIGKTTVNRWSKELGLEYQKHTVDENFFKELNEKSSYLLGYIFADGNIAWDTKKGYYCITITASEKDKDHLEMLRSLIASTKPLLYSPKTKSYRLIVNSKKLCKKLMEYGLTPRKSLTVKLPNIPVSQFKHFLRGVIDGDGSVLYYNRKRSPYFDIRIFSGSKIFCEGLIEAIRDKVGLEANIRKANKSTYEVRYCCSRGEKLANFIYSNADILLERKYLVYKNNVIGGKQNDKN